MRKLFDVLMEDVVEDGFGFGTETKTVGDPHSTDDLGNTDEFVTSEEDYITVEDGIADELKITSDLDDTPVVEDADEDEIEVDDADMDGLEMEKADDDDVDPGEEEIEVDSDDLEIESADDVDDGIEVDDDGDMLIDCDDECDEGNAPQTVGIGDGGGLEITGDSTIEIDDDPHSDPVSILESSFGMDEVETKSDFFFESLDTQSGIPNDSTIHKDGGSTDDEIARSELDNLVMANDDTDSGLEIFISASEEEEIVNSVNSVVNELDDGLLEAPKFKNTRTVIGKDAKKSRIIGAYVSAIASKKNDKNYLLLKKVNAKRKSLKELLYAKYLPMAKALYMKYKPEEDGEN